MRLSESYAMIVALFLRRMDRRRARNLDRAKRRLCSIETTDVIALLINKKPHHAKALTIKFQLAFVIAAASPLTLLTRS